MRVCFTPLGRNADVFVKLVSEKNISMNKDSCESKDSFLFNIPVEIFLHICSFLDARTIICSLSLVCKRFHEIISDDSIWKSRIAKTCRGSAYPAIPGNVIVSFRNACIELEEECELWSGLENKTRVIPLADVHYASVDAVLLLKEGALCVSGARDRRLVVWKLPERDEEVAPTWDMREAAHDGWIWQLVSCGDVLYSASWDHTVKLWDMSTTLLNVSTFNVKCSVLSVTCSADFMAAGTYMGHVYLFDPRAGGKKICTYRSHLSAALALANLGHWIVSASEDKTISVYDQRAGKAYKQGIVLEHPVPISAYPLSLSLCQHFLYVGDSKGYVHLLNPSDGSFEVIKAFDLGHTNSVTAIHHGVGSLITASMDGSVRMFTPTNAPQPVNSYNPRHGEITALSYKNKTLAAANTDCSVDVLQRCSS